MSTSPSWFDQEKFSRLVKRKPGAKASPSVPPTAAHPAAPEPAAPPLPPSIGRASTGPLPPVPRAGSGTLPLISSRTSTGPLPPPRRSTGALPTAAGPPSTASLPPPPTAKSGSISPPPPLKRPSTGPLPPPPSRPNTAPIPPPLTRTTGALPPPPPLRPSTVHLPPPRGQTGKLPLPSSDSPIFRSIREEGAETTVPPAEETAPGASSMQKSSSRPSVPLPDFKPLFGYDKAEEPVDEPAESSLETASWPENTPALSGEEKIADLGFAPSTEPVESTDVLEEDEPTDVQERLKEAEAKLSLITEERDQHLAELDALRQQLAGKEGEPASGEQLPVVSRERDEARMEVIVLRHQLESAEQTQRDTEAMASQLEELSHVIDERDCVRRDYATLRDQFETLKLDRSRVDSTEATADLEAEIQRLREQLAQRGTEKSSGIGESGSADVASLKDEIKKAKDEASMSARGLALSQKALQETREALREASEGTSTSKGGLEDLKKERATLVRQNMLLQGQTDQLIRELSAAKAKLAAKGE